MLKCCVKYFSYNEIWMTSYHVGPCDTVARIKEPSTCVGLASTLAHSSSWCSNGLNVTWNTGSTCTEDFIYIIRMDTCLFWFSLPWQKAFFSSFLDGWRLGWWFGHAPTAYMHSLLLFFASIDIIDKLLSHYVWMFHLCFSYILLSSPSTANFFTPVSWLEVGLVVWACAYRIRAQLRCSSGLNVAWEYCIVAHGGFCTLLLLHYVWTLAWSALTHLLCSSTKTFCSSSMDGWRLGWWFGHASTACMHSLLTFLC